MKTQTYVTLLLEAADGVATVTLNRPERMNAYNWRMGLELNHAFATLDADDSIRAIVVTGAGRAFCAGADLESRGDTFSGGNEEQRKRLEDERNRITDEMQAPTIRPWEMATPIIGAINGAAVGVGITLPMQWDIRIAAEDAKLGFVFTRRGVIPEANSQWILPRLVGLSRALELLLSGRIFTGSEAAEMGLVSRAVPRGDVLPAAQEIARDIAENTAPVSVAMTKKLVYRFLQETDRVAAQELESKLFFWSGRQPDCAEGIESFLEKRTPQWKMSKNNDLPDEFR